MKTVCCLLMLVSCLRAEVDIFAAVRNNQVDAARSYLNGRGDPNKRDAKGHTLLILAAYNDSIDTVDLLLKNGADVHLQDGMGTALMAAGFKGSREIVKRLLAAGARVDERNGIGATALMFAAMTGRVEVVKMLLKHRADIEARDSRGLNAKQLAEQQGNAPMVELLERSQPKSPRR